MLPLEIIQILACPICKEHLTEINKGSFLHCQQCKRSYPVVDGIPALLPGVTDTAHQANREQP